MAFCVVDFILILPNWDSYNSSRQTEYFTGIISRLLGLDKFIFRPKLSSLITTFVVVLKTLESDQTLGVVVGEMPGWMSFKVIGKRSVSDSLESRQRITHYSEKLFNLLPQVWDFWTFIGFLGHFLHLPWITTDRFFLCWNWIYYLILRCRDMHIVFM